MSASAAVHVLETSDNQGRHVEVRVPRGSQHVTLTVAGEVVVNGHWPTVRAAPRLLELVAIDEEIAVLWRTLEEGCGDPPMAWGTA